jgi:formate dehydrogenase subunit gamma
MKTRSDPVTLRPEERVDEEAVTPREAFLRQERFERFSLNQRIQHILLFSSLILLVITGFPLKYPEVEWLGAIYYLTGGPVGARIIHRIAAVVMLLVFVYHNIYIFHLVYRGKIGLKEILLMVPSPKDVKDLIKNIRYFVGLSTERPNFDRFSYIEKFDYWAVYWGMFIMGISGMVLWFPEFCTQFVKLDIIRIAYIAHSDEALLAFLAISCWHMYNVHLCPRHFPMNRVWYKGWITREQMLEEHPLEYERKLEEADAHVRKGSSWSRKKG